jgi:hypothetical protein
MQAACPLKKSRLRRGHLPNAETATAAVVNGKHNEVVAGERAPRPTRSRVGSRAPGLTFPS